MCTSGSEEGGGVSRPVTPGFREGLPMAVGLPDVLGSPAGPFWGTAWNGHRAL